MGSQLQQTQQTQVSNEYLMYDQSFDVSSCIARFVSTCNSDRFETVHLPRREDGHVFTFGRHKSCDFILTGSRFSNIHFKVWSVTSEEVGSRYDGDTQVLMVQDCSTNGTFLNQARIGKGQMTVLANGDELAAGVGVAQDEVRYIVQLPMLSRPNLQSISADPNSCSQKYDIRQILGAGAFATVRCAIDKTTGTKYAVKILNQRKLAITNAKTKATELFKREIEILQSTKHPNVVQYVDMWADSTEIYLVLEFLPGGDLMDYIMKRIRLSEYEAIKIVAQILDALIYCHSIGIAHRDIKPENILLTSDNPPVAKLTDFGLAKMVEPGSFLKTFCGTLTYVAPEVISMHGRIEGAYSTAVDMWSVGCVTFIMLAGSMPFAAEGQEAMMKAIQDCDYDDAALEEIELSGAGMDFIESLLRVNPRSRMTGLEAARHPWIANAEYDYQTSQGQWSNEVDDENSDAMQHDAPQLVSSSQVVNDSQSGQPFIFDDKTAKANNTTPLVQGTPQKRTNGYGLHDDSSVQWSEAQILAPPNLTSNFSPDSRFSLQSSTNFLGSRQYVSASSQVAGGNDSNATITPVKMRQQQAAGPTPGEQNSNQKGPWYKPNKNLHNLPRMFQSEPAISR